MENIAEPVLESVSVNSGLIDLPRVDENNWESMTNILEQVNVSDFKYKKPVPWRGHKFPARIVRVVDADTVNVVFVNERQELEAISVRLHLIDAPETKLKKGVSKLQKETGLSVANYVSSNLPVGEKVTVAVREHCIYNNRVIGAIFIHHGEVEIDLSVHLLERKLVKPYSGDQKRAPWKDEELLSILRLIPDYQTEEAKVFILNGPNGRAVSLGADHPAPVDSTSASLVVPVTGEAKAEGKKKRGGGKKKAAAPIMQAPMAIPFGIPGNQGGATMIIPQNWFQQSMGSQQQQQQPNPYQTGIPVFMQYPFIGAPAISQQQYGRNGRGRSRS